jgi:ElaB/YqjD/DUF883 family membrane-anchored ribosome-binding protein
MKTKQVVGLFICVICLLSTVVTYADGDSWIVIKDKDNICKIIKAHEKTADTIAGPFSRKEQAEEALSRTCPKSTVEKLKEKAAEGLEKAKTEVEKLKEKAAPGIEKAKDAAEKLKEKAGEGIDKAREMIKDHLPDKKN